MHLTKKMLADKNDVSVATVSRISERWRKVAIIRQRRGVAER